MRLLFYFKDLLKDIFYLFRKCDINFFKKSIAFLLVVFIFDISLIILSVVFLILIMGLFK